MSKFFAMVFNILEIRGVRARGKEQIQNDLPEMSFIRRPSHDHRRGTWLSLEVGEH